MVIFNGGAVLEIMPGVYAAALGEYALTVRDREASSAERFTVIAAEIGRQAYDGRL